MGQRVRPHFANPILSDLMTPPPPPSSKPSPDPSARVNVSSHPMQTPCAIVGMSCNFPGADNLNDFWKFLIEKGDGICPVPESRWNRQKWSSSTRNKPGKVISDKGGFISGIDNFDYDFFGISKREAENMDPQQRIVLQLAWLAIEDGGSKMDDIKGRSIGVYLGNCFSDYRSIQVREEEGINPYTITGTATSIIANRISYCFDLKGPSLVVDTACSSALLALHIAVQAISMGEAEAALVGGVQALLHPAISVSFTKLGATGPNGECRPFDASADGYVRSEGAGVCFVKTLDAALRDKDRIYAVVRGTRSNQDGGLTPTLTSPSYEMQKKLIFDAYKAAALITEKEYCERSRIENVQFVEAHGTGTPTGDPIELNAINDTFDNVVVGSVKGNIGHLEGASGIAGLVKAALSVYHAKIPPTNRYEELNPKIKGDNITVNKQAIEWPEVTDDVRRASLNSFGFGGSNVHCILESSTEAAVRKQTSVNIKSEGRTLLPLCLSARSESSLKKLASTYSELMVKDQFKTSYSEIVSATYHLRTHFEHRAVILAHSKVEASAELKKFARGESSPNVISGQALSQSADEKNKLCMVFCGQGAQWYAMACELLFEETPESQDEVFKVFRDSMEECRRYISKYGNWDLYEHLRRSEDDDAVNDTIYSQPATCSIQISLVDQWESFGVKPSAVVGHSVGEVPAAYAAGAYTKETAIRISITRGKHMNEAKGNGLMAAIGVGLEQAEKMLEKYIPRIVVSNINSPEMVTVSGDKEPMLEFVEEVQQKGIFCKLLRLKYSFHSHHMEPLAEPLVKDLEDWLVSRPFKVPFYSVVTGKRLVNSIINAKYIKESMVSPVWFLNAMNTMWNDIKCNAILEVGPHPVLTGAMHQIHKKRTSKIKDLRFFESLRRKTPDALTFISSLARFHCSGLNPNLTPIIRYLTPEKRVEILDTLPKYEFQSDETIWTEMPETRSRRLECFTHPILGERIRSSSEPRWTSSFSFAKFPWVQDHIAHGAVVVPAACFVSIALAAARELKYASLENFEVLNAMSVGEDDILTVETSLNTQTRSLSICSKKEGSTWVEHAKCTLLSVHSMDTSVTKEDVKSENLVKLDVDVFYSMVNRFGFTFGPSFRRLATINQGDSSVVAEYESFIDDDDYYDMHPITIDLMIQSAIALPPRIVHAKMPSYFRHIWARETSTGYTKVHGKVSVFCREKYSTKDADLLMFDESGKLVLSASGFRCNELKNMEEKVPIRTDIEKNSQAVFDSEWREIPLQNLLKDDLPSSEPISIFFHDDIIGEKDRAIGIEKTIRNRVKDAKISLQSVTNALELSSWMIYVAPRSASFSSYMETFLILAKKTTAYIPQKICKVIVLTTNCMKDCRNIQGSPIVGFLRTMRNEQPLVNISIVDVEEESPSCIDIAMLRLSGTQNLLEGSLGDVDEICVRNGNVFVQSWLLTGAIKEGNIESAGESKQEEEVLDDVNFALDIKKRGLLNTLQYERKNRRQLSSNEVEIRIRATAMNFRDVMVAMGMITEDSTKNGYNKYTMGLEGAGVVTRTGKDVHNVSVGDDVFGIMLEPYSRYAITNSVIVRRIPKNLSYSEAATIPVCFLTAYAALYDIADIGENDTVLVHGAAGGVGIAATQLAKLRGAKIIGTAGATSKKQYAAENGCDEVLHSRDVSFYSQVMELTDGRGVDCVINSFADEALQRSLDLLAPFGSFIEIGKRDVYANTAVGLRALGRNATLRVYDLDQYNSSKKRTALVGENLDRLVKLLEIHPEIVHPLPLTTFRAGEIEAAFRFMQQGRHIGKIVVTFEEEDVLDIVKQVNLDATSRFDCNPSRSYVITGGTSGIGLDIAEELLVQGSKHVLLLSRSGVEKNIMAKNALIRFKKRFPSAEVVVERVDVSDRKSLRETLERQHNLRAPVEGIIHAATVYRDVSVSEMSISDLENSLGPKLGGAINIYEITKEWSTIKFFICFSSISAAVGNTGQANYAAANYGVEAVVNHARSEGHMNAVVINMGAVLEVGYLRENLGIARMLQGSGFLPLTPNQVVDAVNTAIQRRNNVGQTMFSGFKYDQISQSLPAFKASRFDAMHDLDVKDQQVGGNTLKTVVDAADTTSDKIKVLEASIMERIIKITGSDSDTLPLDAPFSALGVDSLISTELRTWLVRETNCELSLFELTESQGVTHLARTILKKMAEE